MSAPPSGPPLTVPPPPPSATLRGGSVLPTQAPPTPQSTSNFSSRSNDRFATAKTGALWNANQTTSTSGTSLQRPSTIQTASNTPPTAEELGVKFADTGKTDITDEDRAGWKAFRAKVAMEILTTERTYVQSLHTMIKAYHDPYFEGQKTGLTDKKVAALFTLVKVIVNVGDTFLAECEEKLKNWDQDETIAPTFIKYCPMFRTYRDYASTHQQKITEILGKINSRSAFTSFQEKQMRTFQCHDLASYLITIIQRLPRYSLLLSELIRRTESTHPQAPLLLQALKNINEVATSVNEAMKVAQLVERYMHVQKMFGGVGELVHLWRKLLQEIPCKITRIWQPTSPHKESTNPKDKKEKKEKKHRFVTNDAVLFLFTDCIWIGIKTKDREQKYEETRTTLTPYPLYANEFSLKFSLLTMALHSLSTAQYPGPTVVGDYTYHNSFILTSPIHACCVTFDSPTVLSNTTTTILQTAHEFENTCRTRTLTTSQFLDVPPNGKTNELLCCDRCQIGLYQYHKLGDNTGAYNLNHPHLICNRCEGIVCTACLYEDSKFEQSAKKSPLSPTAQSRNSVLPGFGGPKPLPQSEQAKSPSKLNQLLGGNALVQSYASLSPVHTSEGFGVCPATGRWCKACQAAPPMSESQSMARNTNDDRLGRNSMRNSYLGGTLSADDLQNLLAKQQRGELTSNQTTPNNNSRVGMDLSLRITTGPNDESLSHAPLPTPTSRSHNEQEYSSTPSIKPNNNDGQFNSISQARQLDIGNGSSISRDNFFKPPESPLSTSQRPTFNTMPSLPPPQPISSTPSQTASPTPSSPPPFNTQSTISTSPPPFNSRSSVLPPPLPPAAAALQQQNQQNFNTLPPPLPPGATTPQQRPNPTSPIFPDVPNNQSMPSNQSDIINTSDSDLDVPPPPTLNFNVPPATKPKPTIPLPSDDSDDDVPPPPTTGTPVHFAPNYSPSNNTNNNNNQNQSTPVPPPPNNNLQSLQIEDDDLEREGPPPPPPQTPKLSNQQPPRRNNALVPKQLQKRPSI